MSMKLTENHVQCGGCKNFFSGLSNFDKHRTWGEDGQTRLCLAPQDVGLVLRDNGFWGGEPMSDEQKAKAGWL